MSSRVEHNYVVNVGDSPANLSRISEGSTASPVRISPVQKSNQISNINIASNLKHSLNQYNSYGKNDQDDQSQQYEYNTNGNNASDVNNISYSQSGRPKKETLGGMMKGLTPQQFANMQVYGMNASTRSQQNNNNINTNINKIGTSKSIQSVTLNLQQNTTGDQLETIENKGSLEDVNNPPSQQNIQFQDQDVAPSKYTIRSQAYMKELMLTGEYKKNIERPQSQQYSKAADMLLSKENMIDFEQDNKKKPHLRVYSNREMGIINRLYEENDTKKKKFQETKRENEEKALRECTFSPRLFLSQYNSGSNYNFGSPNQESLYLSKREPTFYEQSQKIKTAYTNHINILQDQKENDEKLTVLPKPKINKRSHQYSGSAFEKRGQKHMNVVQRLYQEKQHPRVPDDTNPYKPSISANAKTKHRKHQKIDEYLYNDAKRRQTEEKQSKSFTHSNSKTKQSINFTTQSSQGGFKSIESNYNSVKHSKNNKKAISSKFDKDFQQAVADMAFTKDPNRRTMPETISYLEVIEILQNLKFINQQSFEENQIIATQVQRVWNQLSCRQDKTRILVRNLEVFLFAVQNIRADAEMIPFITEDQLRMENASTIHHKSNQLNPDESSPRSHFTSQHHQSKQSSGSIDKLNQKLAERAEMINSKLSESKRQALGFFDSNDNLYYTDELVSQIHKQFKDIYDNRLAGEKGSRRISRNNEPNHPFSPEISVASRRLAQERRERVVDDLKRNEGFDGNLDMNEILVYQKQLSRFQNEELKQKLEEEEMSECTFHPQTKDFSKVERFFSPRQNGNNFEDEMQGKMTSERKGATSTKPLGIHRTNELYSLAKPQNQRRDRDKGDIEYEKECDECTFSPDISHIKLAQFSSSGYSQYNNYNSPNKSKHLGYLQQQGVQKSIERIKNARLNQKVNEQLINSGSTFSNKQRQSIEKIVHINLQQEKHTHSRPEGRFISNNHHHHHQHRVIQSSPKPQLFSPQETQDYNHQNYDHQENVDTARSGKSQQNQGDNQDVSEYFLKQPQQGNDKDKQIPMSKTMEEDRVPLLFVDVNIEDGKTARIIVYEGEKSEDLANKFAQEHNLDSIMTGRLKDLLDQQINSLLTKIDEEVGSDREEEEEEEESGEDEQGNFQHRRRQKKQKMMEHIIDNHESQEIHDHHEHEEEEEQTPHQPHIVYTEENFDYLSNQNRLNNPHLQHQNSESEDVNTQKSIPQKDSYNNIPHYEEQEEEQEDEHEIIQQQPQKVDAEVQQKQRTAQEIQDMHLKALAATYQHYTEDEEKLKTLPVNDQKVTLQDMENMHMKALAATFKNYSDNPDKFNSQSQSEIESVKKSTQQERKAAPQEKQKTAQEIQDMHLKALGTTYKNYSESEEKQKTLPANDQKVTLQDMENMHMKALAATYKNYSDNPDKFNSYSQNEINSSRKINESYSASRNMIESNPGSKKYIEYEVREKPVINSTSATNNYSTTINYQNTPNTYQNTTNNYQINTNNYQTNTNNYQTNTNSYQTQYSQPNNSYTVNQYDSSAQKINTSDSTKQLTAQDIMNMHMKAMSSTYQNYSDNPDKFNNPITNTTSSTSYQYPSNSYGGSTSLNTGVPSSSYGVSNTYSSPLNVNYGAPQTSSYTTSSNTANIGSYNTYTVPSTSYGVTSSTSPYGITTNTTGGLSSNPYASSTSYSNPYSYTSSSKY